MTTSFLCTHGPRDERPGEIVPIFRHGRGNARREYQESAERKQLDAGQRLQSTWSPGHKVGLARLQNEDEKFAQAAEDNRAAISAKNHHQLECHTCGFNERISGADIERLLSWAEGEGVAQIPLLAARRILGMIP